jgi:hypothetical protein
MAKEEKQPETVLHSDDPTTSTVCTSPQQNGNPLSTQDSRKKSVAFHLTFVAILVNLFLYALDATTLAVATPVSAHTHFAMQSPY